MGREVYQNCPLGSGPWVTLPSSSSIQTCLCMNAVSQANLESSFMSGPYPMIWSEGHHPASSQAITENQNKLGRLPSFASSQWILILCSQGSSPAPRSSGELVNHSCICCHCGQLAARSCGKLAFGAGWIPLFKCFPALGYSEWFSPPPSISLCLLSISEKVSQH